MNAPRTAGEALFQALYPSLANEYDAEGAVHQRRWEAAAKAAREFVEPGTPNGTIKIRAAVAVSADGHFVISDYGNDDETMAKDALDFLDREGPTLVTMIEATVPLPPKPETVQAVAVPSDIDIDAIPSI